MDTTLLGYTVGEWYEISAVLHKHNLKITDIDIIDDLLLNSNGYRLLSENIRLRGTIANIKKIVEETTCGN